MKKKGFSRQVARREKPRPIAYGLAIGLALGLALTLALQSVWIGMGAGITLGLVIGFSLLANYRRAKGKKAKR